MLLTADGRRFLSLWERALFKFASKVRSALLVKLQLRENGHTSMYACENAFDAYRPTTLWIKEEGTMRWIDAEVRKGDIFMDIGANIGIYAIAAGNRVGREGAVYAFEPHKVNSLSLLRNIGLSGLADRVRVFSCALSDESRVLEFFYRSLESASTASQLGHHHIPGSTEQFRPVATEMVFATTVDRLLADGAIRAPQLIKIDVDGNELQILRGMQQLLTGAQRPRAVQVELNVGEQDAITEFMKGCGYQLAERHFTYAGKQAQAAGEPLENIAHNGIFRPLGSGEPRPAQ